MIQLLEEEYKDPALEKVREENHGLTGDSLRMNRKSNQPNVDRRLDELEMPPPKRKPRHGASSNTQQNSDEGNMNTEKQNPSLELPDFTWDLDMPLPFNLEERDGWNR